ncbi:hypothetical protein Suden_0515 [Sulfurimonas denitrificans DSM 1251]|uniref:Lipoprotein n=2 Tax=Sulfurimonas denitrificans TaxID=39766 RepID=Q30T86_SULDN|nr:hypothetical protein Suden_0515 [Sulfurimonas denitrificans DSM 1251]
MMKYLLLITTLFLFSGCINKHGISMQYYSECKEYYDLQGYYHNECGKDDIISHKEIRQNSSDAYDYLFGEEKQEKPKGNVW